jgi:DNA-binding CsgD family transcriptional regulator
VNAETEFEEALKCAIYPNAEKVRSNIQLNFADYYLSRKLYSKALQHARKSLAEAEKLGHIYFRKEAFRMLHDCHKALNQFKQAYKYLEEYNNIVSESDNDLLRSRLDFHELRYDFEAERAKAEEGRRQAGLLQAELELKERELTEKTRHLIKQTEALSQFRNDLKVMIRRSPADDPLVKSIRERLHEMPEPQVNWEDFDAQFKSVHPLFLHNLTTAYPTLTPMERKICPFLRLNLTSEDIAKLLFLSDRNIENHRYRIRRKFGLGTSASLPEFLEKF